MKTTTTTMSILYLHALRTSFCIALNRIIIINIYKNYIISCICVFLKHTQFL